MIHKQYQKMMMMLGLAGLAVGAIALLTPSPAIAQSSTNLSTISVAYPFITAITAGVLAILQSVLMLAVGMKRLKYSQGVGDGGHEDLTRVVRRHGNLAENAALFLVVLALLEMSDVNRLIVVGVAGLFVLARVSHAIAFSITTGPHPLRAAGATMTALLTIVSSACLIWAVV